MTKVSLMILEDEEEDGMPDTGNESESDGGREEIIRIFPAETVRTSKETFTHERDSEGHCNVRLQWEITVCQAGL